MEIADLKIDSLNFGTSHKFQNNWKHTKSLDESILLEPLHGHYTLCSKNKKLLLNPGNAAFIPSHCETTFIHHFGADSYMEARWIHFSFKYRGIVDVFQDLGQPVILQGSNYKSASNILSLLSKDKQNIGQQLICSGMLFNLLKKIAMPTNRCLQDMNDPLLIKILDHITLSKGIDLSVSSLAQLAYLSPSRFHGWFQQKMDISPMTYVRKQKMSFVAKELLENSDSLENIAEDFGFNNPFHFSRSFKQVYGMSPREYRKNNKIYFT